MYRLSDRPMHWQLIFLFQARLNKSTMDPKFDLTRIQIYDLWIITVHFMEVRRLL